MYYVCFWLDNVYYLLVVKYSSQLLPLYSNKFHHDEFISSVSID